MVILMPDYRRLVQNLPIGEDRPRTNNKIDEEARKIIDELKKGIIIEVK